MEKLENLLSIERVSEKLEIKPYSVKEMVKKGLAVHKIGKLNRYREQEVIDFIIGGNA